MPIHSPEFLKKRKRRRKIIFYSLVVVLFVLIGLLSYGSHRPEVTISSFQINNNSVVRSEDIEQLAREILTGKYFWLFSKKNSFIYPRIAVKEKMLREFPRLSSVKLDVIDFKTLSITVEEREPAYLYCKKANVENSEGCYFMDSGGYIFSLAPSFSGSVYFVFTSKEEIADPIGQRFINEEVVRELLSLVEDVESVGVYAQVLEYGEESSKILLANSSEIIWKTSDGIKYAEESLTAFMSDEKVASDTDFLDKLLYMDLRFKNKVFYKLRD